MKRIFSLYNLGLMFTLVLASFIVFKVVDVYAAVTWTDSKNSITISRSVTSAPAAVTNTFTYTVAAVSGNPAGATGAPTSASIAMSNQAISSNTATKTTTLSFSSMTFARPGDYSYTITETGSTNTTLYPKDTTTYTALISVRNVLDSNNVPTGNYTATLQLKKGSTKQSNLTATFTSAVPSSQYGSVSLSKGVTGNSAELSQYFEYTVKIDTAGTYSITGLTSGVTCGSTTQSSTTASITGGSSSAGTKICLKHGQTAVIGKSGSVNAIPIGAKITITETDTDYSESYKYDSGSVVSSNTLNQQAITAGNHTVAFTNDKTVPVPTGILITIIPYLILIAIAAGGVVTFVNLKRKRPAFAEE